MNMSRRGFMAGAAALTAGAVAADPVLGKVVLAREAPRQVVKLEGHRMWDLVRPHVLGHLSLAEMATGLPGPWQEFLASWEVEGVVVKVPILTDWPTKHPRRDVSEDFFGAKLNSGYEMALDQEHWQPFYDKWNREVFEPVHGYKMRTINLGAAVLTNITLFRMALKYSH